jgi:hypothetical protein
MSTKALNQTKDYSIFLPHEHQQPMSEHHVKRIAESMARTGFWQSKPLSVVRKAGKFVIVDGHHRYAAAKGLGLAVFYVIEADFMLDEIGRGNSAVRVWSVLSFAKMFAAKGDPHYVELLNYVSKGFALRNAASLLRGESAHSGNANDYVKTGTFKIKTRASIDTIFGFMDEFGETCPAVKSAIFVEALSVLLFVQEFDCGTLKARIRTNPLSLVKCNNRQQMLDQIEELYNFRARDKVPLAFLAKEMMTSRKCFISRAEAA